MAQRTESDKPKTFNSGIFLTGLATAFGLWIIVGALAYNDRTYPTEDTAGWGFVLTCTIIPLTFFTVVGNTLPEYEAIASPPRKASGWAITVVLTFSISTTIAFCIATVGNRRLLEHVFLILSSTYAAVLAEAATGCVTGFSRRLESAAALSN